LRLGNMWGGRRVTQLTPTDFMERLGSIGVGNKIRETATNTEKNAADVTDNALKGVAQKIAAIDVSAEIAAAAAATGQSAKDTANAALNAAIAQKLAGINVSEEIKKVATTTGQIAADTLDTVLKDIAQKFDGFGKDAASYFEGRARFMSVMVAIVLAFAVHVDAVDLFKTYLRDPNARAKVIEQSQAVTAQYKAAQDAADAAKKLVPDPNAAPADVKAAVEKLQKDWAAAIANTNTTVKQYADLGVPLGWTDVRIADAKMWHWLWTCKNLNAGDTERLWTLRQECRTDDAQGYTAPRDQEGRPLAGLQHKNIWMEVPTAPGVWLYLILGGLLIGLGSPFWFDAVTSLTSLRSAVSGSPGSASQPAAGAAADAGKGQPVTPVGAFRVSNAALNAQPK
jgi:hypothetical protein